MQIFSKKPKVKDAEKHLSSCIDKIYSKVLDEFNSPDYYWNRPYGVQKFESLVLSKYILEHTFKFAYGDDPNPEDQDNFQRVLDAEFEKIHDKMFSSVDFTYQENIELINQKVESYKDLRREYKPPVCWHSLFSLLTNNPSIDMAKAELLKHEHGLALMRNNQNFVHMVGSAEQRIIKLKNKVASFESTEIFIPRIIRMAKDNLLIMPLKMLKKVVKKLDKAEAKK